MLINIKLQIYTQVFEDIHSSTEIEPRKSKKLT